MFGLLSLLFAAMVIGGAGLFILAVIGFILKTTFRVALLPLKLLFLPLLLVLVVLKVIVVVAALAVVGAIVIPILVLLLIFAAPFALVSLFT